MNPTLLIADDEPLLLDQLVQLLDRVWPEARIVATASNGAEAKDALQEHQPDVAFLDIRMPSPDGLELAEEFASGSSMIVFVTAYDQYAVAAFEKNACDYLLKPISEERLRETVKRLEIRLATSSTTVAIASVREEIEKLKQTPTLSRIPVKHQGETKLVDLKEIRYFKAEAKYTIAYDAKHEYVLSITLREMETQLDEREFWRIHRNCIVNAKFIESVRRTSNASLLFFAHIGYQRRIAGESIISLPLSRLLITLDNLLYHS